MPTDAKASAARSRCRSHQQSPDCCARLELGDAIDRIAERRDKRGVGAVGVLTGGLVDRQRAYEPLVAYALARWLASDWWES